MRLLAAAVAALWTLGAAAPGLQVPADRSGRALYDADPEHLWNRLHRHFQVRVGPDGTEHGFDSVNPLLWDETHYLLRGPSHDRAVRLLDEFLAAHGERSIADPVKRAVLQHDLWAIFDWLASRSDADREGRRALMPRVARVMRRVALTRAQIEQLPDAYAAAIASRSFLDASDPSQPRAFLPRDLLSVDGPWVGIGGTGTVVPHHASELSRSSFVVLWNLPGGAAATTKYLQSLWDFPQPFVRDDTFQMGRDGELRATLNPALPPLPDGTRIALVRSMLLVDDQGGVVPSGLIESIQLREFRRRQTFFELVLSRTRLFAGQAGGLRAVELDEGGFITFSSKGLDPFEAQPAHPVVRTSPVLAGCRNCHQDAYEPPLHTILSLRQMLRPRTLADSRHERWARWFPQGVEAAAAKSRAYDWGLLQGIWQSVQR